MLTLSAVRAAEHVGVRGVAEALPRPGPQVAQVLVILHGDDNDDDDSDDDDDDDDDEAHLAGHEAALLEAEADQLVAAPAPALATLPPAVSITSNIFVYIHILYTFTSYLDTPPPRTEKASERSKNLIFKMSKLYCCVAKQGGDTRCLVCRLENTVPPIVSTHGYCNTVCGL